MPMDGKTQTCGFLDQMSTEQLYDLIRTDFEYRSDDSYSGGDQGTGKKGTS